MKDFIKEIITTIVMLFAIICGLAFIILPVFFIKILIPNEYIATFSILIWATFFCLLIKRFYK